MKIRFYLRLLVFTMLGLASTQWLSAQNVTISPKNGSLLCASAGTSQGYALGSFATWRHNQLSLTMTGSNSTTLTSDGQLSEHANHLTAGDKLTFTHTVSTSDASNWLSVAWGRTNSNNYPGYFTIALPKGYRFTGYTFHLTRDVSGIQGQSTYRPNTTSNVTISEMRPNLTNPFSEVIQSATVRPWSTTNSEPVEFKRTGDDMGNILYFRTLSAGSGFFELNCRYIELTFTADADATVAVAPSSSVSSGRSLLEIPFHTGKVDFGAISKGSDETRQSYYYTNMKDISANLLLYEEESVEDNKTAFDGTVGKMAISRSGSITTSGNYFRLSPSSSKTEQVYFLETPVSAPMPNNPSLENPVQFRIVGAEINYRPSSSGQTPTIYIYDAAGEEKETITITAADSYPLVGLNNDAIKIGVKGGDVADVNFSLILQALNPFIDQMTVVMNDTDDGKDLRMTLPFTTDDFSVGGDEFHFYLPAECEGDEIRMTFEDLYSKYGDETYDHTSKPGTSDSRYNYVMSQHYIAYTGDNIYNNKAEAQSEVLETMRIKNNSMIRTQVGIAGNIAYRFNNADALADENGYFQEFPFTQAKYASFTDKDGNIKEGSFDTSKFSSAATGDNASFYVFTTDETKYNIAPTTATQHRFYAFYKMDVRLTVGTYTPTIEFVPIYNHSFYLDKDNKELQNGFCGVKVTTSVENGVVSDVGVYQAILKGISDGIANAPEDISHILYIDLSSLGATFHSNEKGSDGKELLADFNELKSKLATNALIFLPQNSTSTFDNFAYKKNGEVVSFQASNDIVLTDKQPFYSPYSIQVDAKNKAKYIREQSAAKYGQVQWASLMLPFSLKLSSGVYNEGGSKLTFYAMNSGNAIAADNYNTTMGNAYFTQLTTDATEANKPYVLHVDTPPTDKTQTFIIEEPAASFNSTLTATPDEVLYDGYVSGGDINGTNLTFTHKGSYSGIAFDKKDIYAFYIANNVLNGTEDYAYDIIKMFPFRSMYTYPKPATPTPAKMFNILIGENIANGIEDVISSRIAGVRAGHGCITINAAEASSYNIVTLAGQKIGNVDLQAGESSTINVPAGVYLVNSMKVLVK